MGGKFWWILYGIGTWKNSQNFGGEIIMKTVIISSKKITQENCSHGAKVMMPGYKNRYECLTCHKFITISIPKEIDHRAPQYLENSWEDDDWLMWAASN